VQIGVAMKKLIRPRTEKSTQRTLTGPALAAVTGGEGGDGKYAFEFGPNKAGWIQSLEGGH